MRVCFNQEAPRLGSGWRIVLVQIGRKVAHVKDQHGHRVKLPRRVWEEIARTAQPLKLKKKRRRS